MASVPHKRYSVDEYLVIDAQSNQRHEYYRGEIFAMVGSTPNHVRIVRNLMRMIDQHLQAGSGCEVFFTDLQLLVEASELYTYPDIAVACPPKFEGRALTNPKMICEVLSPSTEKYDRGTKFDFYRKLESLEEYILVSQRQPQLERFVRQPNGDWTLSVFKGPETEFELVSIRLRSRLAAVYRDVVFTDDDADGEAELRVHPE